jgi:MFS family permease
MIWVAALLVFSISRVFLISVVAMFVAGYAQLTFIATANNRIQTITPDNLRGRVMALYAQALIGVGPIGSLQAGALATVLSPPWAMAIGAVIAGAVIAAIRLTRPLVFEPVRDVPAAAIPSAPTGLEEI